MFNESTRVFTLKDIDTAINKLSLTLAATLEFYCAKHEIIFVVILKSGGKFAFTLFDRLLFSFRYTFVYTKEQEIDRYKMSLGIPELLYYNLEDENINNNVVVLLDSVCDSGATLKALKRRIAEQYKPKKIFSCVLIKKSFSTFNPDFCGLVTKNKFLVGYGIGLNDKYRNLQAVHQILKVGE